MNIGFISQALPYLPAREGFRLYCANILKGLTQRHRVDLISLLAPGDSDHLEWARDLCASVHTLSLRKATVPVSALNFIASYWSGLATHQRTEMRQLLEQAARDRKWDVLHVEGGFAGSLVADFPGIKVLSVHDSWTLRCGEMLRCSQTLREKLFYRAMMIREPRLERKLYSRFDCCSVVGARDAEEVRRVVPGLRVDVVSNGTDIEYFSPRPVQKNGSSLVFHSHLGYAPNIAAAIEFAEEIFPRVRAKIPEASFHLIGAEPVQKIKDLALRAGIRLSADLPDLRDAVCEGDVYVCAIKHGTGVKNKVLEAMAMRVPVVCYPDAIIGIDCEPGRDVMVADSADDFADLVIDLLRNPERRSRIAANGRALVEQKYSWEGRVHTYERLYADLIEQQARQKSDACPVSKVAIA